jgi:DNA-binding XRE family transcriptional regulator
MTTIRNNTKIKYEQDFKQVKTCFVTDQINLSKTIRNHWNYNDLKIKDRLADLINDRDCGLYVIDTETKDMNIWPAPFLSDPDAESKLWVFLVSKIEDTNRLEPLPAKAKFFDRGDLKLEELVVFIRNQFDTGLRKKIEVVFYLENLKSFVIRMKNGKTYILKVSDLSEADSSKVTEWTIGEDHSHFRVIQKSGNWFEVPWDDVLYHCEPSYEYFNKNDSVPNLPDENNKIGQKIKQLRITKGYSIEALAQKAGMKRPNLSRLENGKHQPSLETLEHIAEALDITVAEILTKS